MARYIDADKLEEALRVDYDREGEKADTYAANGDADLAVKYSHGQFCYHNAMERVKDAPTADVAPRAEVIDEFVKRLLDAFPEPHRGGNLCPAIYYDDYREIIEELAVELKEAEGNK